MITMFAVHMCDDECGSFSTPLAIFCSSSVYACIYNVLSEHVYLPLAECVLVYVKSLNKKRM